MNKYLYNEFIRYDERFTKEKNEFYGEYSPLSSEESREFLEKYAEAKLEEYGMNSIFSPAVTSLELSRAMLKMPRTAESISFTASHRPHVSGYERWQLYTQRASIEGDTVILSDNFSIPTAAAKCDLPKGIEGMTLTVAFDESYRRDIPGGVLITTPGKQIDLRAGAYDSARIFFAQNGSLILRVNESGDIYHYSDKLLGEFPFAEPFDIRLSFTDEGYTVSALGTELTMPYLEKGRPDTLFLSGGLQPTSEWLVRVSDVSLDGGESVDLFVERTEGTVSEKKIGKVTLPYVIGTKKLADRELILRGSFRAYKGVAYALKFDSLDPGGEVWLNGALLKVVDSPNPFVLNVSENIKDGSNELQVVVYPRAPELLYVWHRHRDAYNGWFSLGIELLSGKTIVETEPVVYTEGEGTPTEFKVRWETGLSDASFMVSMKKLYPKEGAFVTVGMDDLKDGVAEMTVTEPFDAWSPDSPNVYAVRVDILDEDGLVFSRGVTTGFRNVCQKDGAIYINGEKTVLKGALNMQFLPPYDEIPLNHVCPSTEQIVREALAIKNMNGNCMRLHQLGYGTSDKRFAEVCDRLGVMLIWTTRAIDSAEEIMQNSPEDREWKLAEDYKTQMREVINHPSIIMWEGSNELHAGLGNVDKLYDAFVDTVKSVDTTRLICPVSHLYYGGGLYDGDGTTDYYNDDGTKSSSGEDKKSSYGWLDPLVVRSAHTYSLTLGYGRPWHDMVTQNWKWQDELFNSKDKAYLVSEFAIIGKQNPMTPEAKKFINKNSYEIPNEKAALGYNFADEEWIESQAYQALMADMAIRQLRRHGADGMLWCALRGGANDASYLKPPIDFYGYTKLAFYRIRDAFSKALAAGKEPDALWYKDYELTPLLTGLTAGKTYALMVEVIDENGETVAANGYEDFVAESDTLSLTPFAPSLKENGYYTVRYTLLEE